MHGPCGRDKPSASCMKDGMCTQTIPGCSSKQPLSQGMATLCIAAGRRLTALLPGNVSSLRTAGCAHFLTSVVIYVGIWQERSGYIYQCPHNFVRRVLLQELYRHVILFQYYASSLTYNTTFHAYAQASTSVSLLSVDGQPGVLNAGLLDKQRMLEEHHKALREFPSMPIYTAPPAHAQHRLLTDQLAYYGTALAAHLATTLPQLTPEQRSIYDAIQHAINEPAEVCSVTDFCAPNCHSATIYVGDTDLTTII